MNKALILSIIVCMAASSTSSFGMFRLLKKSRTQAPRHVRTYCINEKEISNYKLSFLENLYSRNTFLEKIIPEQLDLFQETNNLIKKQTTIIINHAYNQEPLNRAQLIALEKKIKNNFMMLMESMRHSESIISDYRSEIGHPNE